MKVREHRGSLEESMATVAEIEPTYDALAEFFSKNHNQQYRVDQFEIKPYGFDKRIDWNTHVVTINGNAVGFTDQMPTLIAVKVENQSLLVDGCVPAGQACPFKQRCEMDNCPKNEVTDRKYSCGLARGFDLVQQHFHKKA